ncbi:MAG: hypothetical protein HOV96_19645 [Nonomuraea sp.]|nr:hypothetical protein [Nonomuraea sp.]
MAMIAAVPAVEAAAAPVAEAAAGRAAGGAAAKRAGGSAAKKAGKKAAGAGAGRTPKPAASDPAGGPTPPPAAPDMANDLLGGLQPPAKKLGASVKDSFKSATLKPPSRLNAHDATGFAFGMVLYALALSAIRYGFPDGPKGWFSAKFINKVILSETDQVDRPRFRKGTPPPDPRTWPIR